MNDVKTKPTTASVENFIAGIKDAGARADSLLLVDLMAALTGEPAVMWGTAIIGFGTRHYKYESGREGDICKVGFSPRKGKLSLYVLSGFPGQDELLAQLGKYNAGKSCLYIKKLEDVDLNVLKGLISGSCTYLKGRG